MLVSPEPGSGRPAITRQLHSGEPLPRSQTPIAVRPRQNNTQLVVTVPSSETRTINYEDDDIDRDYQIPVVRRALEEWPGNQPTPRHAILRQWRQTSSPSVYVHTPSTDVRRQGARASSNTVSSVDARRQEEHPEDTLPKSGLQNLEARPQAPRLWATYLIAFT